MYNRTIGEIFKEKRIEKGINLDEAVYITKISKKYLAGIENNDFTVFSSEVQAQGFLRNYALFLKVDPQFITKLYKRDYEKKKPARRDFIKKQNFHLTPKKIYIFIALVCVLVFVGLIINIINKAFQPPVLIIHSPIEASAGDSKQFFTSSKTVTFTGETQDFTLIKINNLPLPLRPGFSFQSEEFPITSETNDFKITAESQLGRESEINIQIVREDIRKSLTEQKTIQIKILDKPVFLEAKGDDVIQYSDFAVPNSIITVDSSSTLEITSDTPSDFIITYLGKAYTTKENDAKFTISEGKLVQ